MKTVHIIKGRVTNLDAYEGVSGVKLGDIEWQFSDGPPGERGSSNDYLNLEDGLKNSAPAIFYFHD